MIKVPFCLALPVAVALLCACTAESRSEAEKSPVGRDVPHLLHPASTQAGGRLVLPPDTLLLQENASEHSHAPDSVANCKGLSR